MDTVKKLCLSYILKGMSYVGMTTINSTEINFLDNEYDFWLNPHINYSKLMRKLWLYFRNTHMIAKNIGTPPQLSSITPATMALNPNMHTFYRKHVYKHFLNILSYSVCALVFVHGNNFYAIRKVGEDFGNVSDETHLLPNYIKTQLPKVLDLENIYLILVER